jgi:hypothetical protein
MMALSVEDLRFAVDDARRRHAALVDLIHALDRQALGFLQLYIALSGGALSGMVAILFTANSAGFPHMLGYFLYGFAMFTVIGAIHCVIAMWPAKINMPGHLPEFWIWADRDDVGAERAYRAYLNDLVCPALRNEKVNASMAWHLTRAKINGVIAPLAGIAIGLLSYIAGL